MGYQKHAITGTILLFFVCLDHCGSSGQAPLRTFALEDLIPPRPDLYPDRLNVQWISATEYIYTDPAIGVLKYDAALDRTEEFLSNDDLVKLNGLSISTFSDDTNYLLMSSNRQKVYRYSSVADYSVYDIHNKFLLKLADGPLQAVVWSTGGSLAYVQKNNVYYVADVTRPNQAINLTWDGIPGEVYNGVTDWIYEEEVFNAAEALWFSKNGTYLAVASFNDTLVPSIEYPYYGNPLDAHNQYPESIKFKYPKAGRENPVVKLQVFKIEDEISEAFLITPPSDIVGEDHILGSVNWASDSNLIVLWLNRRQNVSVLTNCDLNEDRCSMVKERIEPNGWIDVPQPIFDKSGTEMISVEPLFHGDKRFMHASRLNLVTLSTEDLTPGNSTVTEVVGWGQSTDTVYFIVAPSNTPWQRQVWSTSKGKTRCITCKLPKCHNASPNFSPGADYAIISCSAVNEPPTYFLYKSNNDEFKIIKDNKALKKKLSLFKLPMVLFASLELEQGVRSHVKLLLPRDMVPGQKYPMIVRVYAGPSTSRVRDNFELEYATYLSTNRSIIVASIDVRGTNIMGVEPMFAVNNALGTYEVTDTLAAIRRLAVIYDFIDPKRVGVWGWSYGGFATTMMLVKDDKKTIACGAAVAPVTSWLYYDSIYTERYMDTPDNNLVGYKQSDLMRHVEKLRSRKFLLIHGSGDDNVHFQNSLLLAKRLQRADIPFEQMSYTDENHSLLGVSRHFYHTLDHFWTECIA